MQEVGDDTAEKVHRIFPQQGPHYPETKLARKRQEKAKERRETKEASKILRRIGQHFADLVKTTKMSTIQSINIDDLQISFTKVSLHNRIWLQYSVYCLSIKLYHRSVWRNLFCRFHLQSGYYTDAEYLNMSVINARVQNVFDEMRTEYTSTKQEVSLQHRTP